MLVRKLRLKNGWSQEHLAELLGVSTRTVQRIERGQKPGLETAKALSSVFEVDISTFLTEESDMDSQNHTAKPEPEIATVSKEEEQALEYVKGVKEFVTHLQIYLVMVAAYAAAFGYNFYQGELEHEKGLFLLLGATGWGIGVLIHGLVAFEKIHLGWLKGFGPNWEKKMVEKRLGRKL